jgi:hypothetical protein
VIFEDVAEESSDEKDFDVRRDEAPDNRPSQAQSLSSIQID